MYIVELIYPRNLFSVHFHINIMLYNDVIITYMFVMIYLILPFAECIAFFSLLQLHISKDRDILLLML